MGVLSYILLLALVGLIVGALARLALPGKDPLSIPQTIGLGILGSFAAGLVTYAIFGEPRGAGILPSVIFAAVPLYFIRRSRGGGLMDPGRPPEDERRH
jgi:uncharacterized membrane protein YeaQ/YmgE (transglycosylase-associated protein family)